MLSFIRRSRVSLNERPLGVLLGQAREPLLRLMRAWTGENPLQPHPANHLEHIRRTLPDCQRGYP